jgi:hypothetical protein
MTGTDPKALAALISEIGLTPVKDDWVMGDIDGVPIALNVVATTEASGLLFHVRYPEMTFADEHPPLPEGSALAEMVQAKEADVSLDSKTGWLNIFSPGADFDAARLRQVLNEFFDVLKTQGVDLRRRLCLKCTAQPVARPGFEDDRMQLLCDACRTEAEDRHRRETELAVGNIPLLLVPGVISALLGAIVWAGIWYSYPIVLEKLSGGQVPVVILGLIYWGSGVIVGKIVSFFLTRVRNRGTQFAAWMAVLFCGAAAVLGEGLLVAGLCLKYLGGIPALGVIAELWIAIMREFSGLYVVGKLVSVGTALYIAYHDARPKKRII